jgi:hypothetical protein
MWQDVSISMLERLRRLRDLMKFIEKQDVMGTEMSVELTAGLHSHEVGIGMIATHGAVLRTGRCNAFHARLMN